MKRKAAFKTTLEELDFRRNEVRKQLTSIIVQEGMASSVYGGIGYALNVSGQTIRNYLAGNIKDGYLAEAIYKEFKRLKIAK